MPKSVLEDGEIIEHDQASEVIEISSSSDDSPRQTPVISPDVPVPVLEPPVRPLNSHFPQSSTHSFTHSPPPDFTPYPNFNNKPWRPSLAFANPAVESNLTFDQSRFGHQTIAPDAQQWDGRQEGGFRSMFGAREAFGSRGDVRIESFRDGGQYVPSSFEMNEGFSPAVHYNPRSMRTSPDINHPHQVLYGKSTHPHVNFVRGPLDTNNGLGPKESADMGTAVHGKFGARFGDALASREMHSLTGYTPPSGGSTISQEFATTNAQQQSLYEKFPPGNVASGGVLQGLGSSQEGLWSRSKPSTSIFDDMGPSSSVFMPPGIVTSPVPVPDDASPLSMRGNADEDGRGVPYMMEPRYRPAMPSIFNRAGQNVKSLIDHAPSVIGSHDEKSSLNTARFDHSRGVLSAFPPLIPHAQGQSPGEAGSATVHVDAHDNGGVVEAWPQNMSGYKPDIAGTHYISTKPARSVLFEQAPGKSVPTLDISHGGTGPADTAEGKTGKGEGLDLLSAQEPKAEVRHLLHRDAKMASSDRIAQTEENTNQPIGQPTIQRKSCKPSLLELRKKVLLSMMQKPKMMEQGQLNGHDKHSLTSIETSPELTYLAKHNADMKHTTPPSHSISTGLQYTQLIVEVSDTESEDGSESTTTDDFAEDAEGVDREIATRGRQPASKLPREKIIENMKIRMVQIGRCPSSLEIKKTSRSSPSATGILVATATQGHVQSAAKQETVVQNEVDRQNEDNYVVMTPETIISPTDGLLKSMGSNSPKESGASLEKPSAMNVDQAVISRTNTDSELPTNLLKGSQASETKGPSKARSEYILSLKKQIAALEARNVRKRKFVAMDRASPSCVVGSLRTDSSPAERKTDVMSSATPQAVVLSQKSKQPSDLTCSFKKNEMNMLEPASKRRYYSAEASRKENERKVSSSKMEPTMSSPRISQPQQEQNHKTPEELEELGVWNQRQSVDIKNAVLVDHANAGLLDDLKFELEIQKRQIANIQDYSKLVLASDISLAQAAAKLSFKRNRMTNLEQEMKRAQFEVIDAEQDYNKIANAAKRMRATLDGLGFSDMFPPPDISTVNNGGKNPTLANGTVRSNGGSNEEPPQSDTESCEKTDLELHASKTGGEDPILQQSPYSPSTGDTFLSCMSGLQSYANFSVFPCVGS